MVTLWSECGYFVVTLWLLCGYFVVNLWLICGYFVVTMWLLCGYYVFTLWLLCGDFVVTMVTLWLLCGYNGYLHPWSVLAKSPAITQPTSIPTVIISWLHTVIGPLQSLGSCSAIYTGPVIDTNPAGGVYHDMTDCGFCIYEFVMLSSYAYSVRKGMVMIVTYSDAVQCPAHHQPLPWGGWGHYGWGYR